MEENDNKRSMGDNMSDFMYGENYTEWKKQTILEIKKLDDKYADYFQSRESMFPGKHDSIEYHYSIEPELGKQRIELKLDHGSDLRNDIIEALKATFQAEYLKLKHT